MKHTLLLFFACIQLASSQSLILKPLQTKITKGSLDHMKSFALLQLDIKDVAKQINASAGNIKELTLQTPEHKWHLQLFEFALLNPKMQRLSGGPGALNNLPFRSDFRTFRGTIKGESSTVIMSMANGFFKIMIDDGQDRFYIEPLDQVNTRKDIDKNQQFISYKASDIIPMEGLSCGAIETNQEVQRIKNQIQEKASVAAPPCRLCIDLKVCLAADNIMFRKNGGDIIQTENAMISILAEVQPVFDDEFEHEYELNVTGTWVADDPARDPFNGITDIDAELAMMNVVGPQIFTFSAFNIGTLWSAKWTSGVVGRAVQRSVCTLPNPFNVCSAYFPTNMSPAYSSLQAHEFGHNFDMIHDVPISGHIMASKLTVAKTWSTLSTSYLNNFVNFGFLVESGCLQKCQNSQYPQPAFIADITYGCAPVTVQFTDQSLYASNWNWTFPGGMPATSTLQNPIVVYRNAGSYDVGLEAGNNRCKVASTKTGFIKINDVPVADFTFGLDTRVVYFINQSQLGNEYLWKFGDGSESDEENPTHEYDRDSTYEVSLRVTNDCGVKTFKRKITISRVPEADFEADTTAGCAPKVIHFIDKSTNNVIRWEWSFPGGNPTVSLAQNPFVRYDNPGTYDAQLTVYSARFKNGLTKKIYITIDSLPDAEFTYTINGNTVSFNAQSKFAKSHFWIFGDPTRPNNTSTDTLPSHTYLEGRYEVLYIVNNACGKDTAKTIITIGTKPIAGFQVNDHQGCLPFQVQFNNTSTAAANLYRWYFPGGNPSTSTDKNPIVTYNTVGKFNVSLFAYNNFFSDSIGITNYIEVKTEPTASFTNSISGFKSFFTHQAIGATNYFWDFGDNKASFEENPTHDYQVEGEFDVKLIVQNECGLDTFSKHIAVYLVPKVNFSADTIRGCAPFTVKFNEKASIDVTDWEWQFENGIPAFSTEKNPTVVFNKKGKYTIRLLVRNSNGSNVVTKVQYIQVLSPVLCPEYTKTNRFGISDIPFGGSLLNRENEIDYEVPYVYPNPAMDFIYVVNPSESLPPLYLEIFDPMGRKLSQHHCNEIECMIPISNLKNGSYFIKIKDGTNTFVRKFIIAN
ncbi:MAG: PKD domain-containing protein [Saprospiraceae bacterium]